MSEQEEHHVKNEDEIDESHKLQLNKLVSVASELWGQGHGDIVAYPPSSGLVPPVPPSQRCGLCQNFKQTTLTTRLYKVRTNLYPPLTKTFRRAWFIKLHKIKKN